MIVADVTDDNHHDTGNEWRLVALIKRSGARNEGIYCSGT